MSIYHCYTITNLLNGKVYVGQTQRSNPYIRWQDHIKIAKSKSLKRDKKLIHQEMEKYGIQNFKFDVICCCRTKEDLNETEILLIKQYDSYNNGYNLTLGGSVGNCGYKWTDEQRARISGKNHPHFGKSVNRGIKNGMFGKTNSNKKYIVTFKDGRTSVIDNRAKFSRENGYQTTHLSRVINGEYRAHKDIIKMEHVDYEERMKCWKTKIIKVFQRVSK